MIRRQSLSQGTLVSLHCSRCGSPMLYANHGAWVEYQNFSNIHVCVGCDSKASTEYNCFPFVDLGNDEQRDATESEIYHLCHGTQAIVIPFRKHKGRGR